MKKLGRKTARRGTPPDFLAVLCVALARVISDVASDPRNLKPGELCRLLNSTPLGQVLSDRRLREHRTRAGLRLGDGKSIDLLRYAAWLAGELPRSKPSAAGSPTVSAEKASGAYEAYEAKKERERERNAEASRTGRDIGELPPVKDPQRRAKALASYQAFCRSYFPHKFTLESCEDQNRLDGKIESAVSEGGLQAFAMPRGSGKTTRSECAVIWSVLTGKRKFAVLIGASRADSTASLETIKAEFETNDLLAEDFPEVCVPIRELEGINNRCKGQTCCGERTHIKWAGDTIVMPTIKGSAASGAIIRVRSITGTIRGMKFKPPGAKEDARPDLVIIDDPQTDRSARSWNQCRQRLNTITGTILGLAGPGKKIAALMPCTVIQPDDVADQLLNREKHPEWHGERTKLLYAFPTNMALWDEFAERRRVSLRNDGDGSEATAFYKKNRKAMDEGSIVAWPARKEEGEISALQNAMTLYYERGDTFMAEFQNEPRTEVVDFTQLTITAVESKLNNLPRAKVPLEASKLTAFIDVQHKLLYYVVAAWRSDFTGAVVDYGTYPEQGRSHFTLRQARKTLDDLYPKRTAQERVAAGLRALQDQLSTREWEREDGAKVRLDRGLTDAKDGTMSEVIASVIRSSSFSALWIPSSGVGIGPKQRPMHQYSMKPGEKIGTHWLLQRNAKFAVRWVLIDTNFWKTTVYEALAAEPGDRGSLTLFGDRHRPPDHRMFAEHCLAEKRDRLRSETSGRSVDVWTLPPAKPDNHLWDGVVGCAVAASMEGCDLLGRTKKPIPKKKRRPNARVASLF
jgi:hypothetical protein